MKNSRPANLSTIEFDLKKPCDECPFRKKAEFHNGIFKDLPKFYEHMESKTFAFTCHKTDPMADSEIGKRNKKNPQHCAGVLAMMNNNVSLLGALQIAALSKRKWNPEKMCKKSLKQVFPNMKAMIRHYLGMYLKRKTSP